jgi:hypothetical protein
MLADYPDRQHACPELTEVLTMSLHNGDKARSNRRRKARLRFRESIRELKKGLAAPAGKKPKAK